MRPTTPYVVVIMGTIAAGCAATPPSRSAPDAQLHTGKVVRVAGIPTVNRFSDFERSYMAQMFGVVGLAAGDAFNAREGYPVYRVKVNEDLELAVASRDEFSEGDCVAVWYSNSFGNRHYFGLGEAGIAKSSGCNQPERK
jgi:hypothetical protein